MIISPTTSNDIANSVDPNGYTMRERITEVAREHIEERFDAGLDVDKLAGDIAHAAMVFFVDLDLTDYTTEETETTSPINYAGTGMGSSIAAAVREFLGGESDEDEDNDNPLDVAAIADDVAHAAMIFFGDLNLNAYELEED